MQTIRLRAAMGARDLEKVRVGDGGEAADQHVLRVAGEGGDAADVGRHGDGEQVGDRIALEGRGDFGDQRGEDQADGVVHEEGGEHGGDGGDRGEKGEGVMGMLDHPLADEGEKSGDAEVRDDDHHAEEKHDGIEIDRSEGLVEGEDVRGDHEAGADDGGSGAIDAKARHAADG